MSAARHAADQREFSRRRNTVIRTVLLVAFALLVGFGVGALVSPRLWQASGSNELAGKSSVPQEHLDAVLGTYEYDGERIAITVRDAVEQSSSVESAKNADGSYGIPSVDTVLAIARNNILLAEAASRDIAANDEETAAYANDTLGTSDYAIISASYQMDVDRAKALMQQSATIRKLRDAVVTTKSLAQPQAPSPAEEGKEDEPSPEYAAYVIGLIGDEWDSNANTWARENGPFREALKDYTISNDAATYAAAQAAFYVARTQYAATEQQISSEWTDFVNALLSQATVQLSSLVA